MKYLYKKEMLKLKLPLHTNQKLLISRLDDLHVMHEKYVAYNRMKMAEFTHIYQMLHVVNISKYNGWLKYRHK